MIQELNVKIEYQVLGNNGQTLVFLNGFRMPFDSWSKVYPELTKKHRILLFNRQGVGKSPKADKAQVGAVVIETLQTLLAALNLNPPYVLVAHSLGGLFANLYARLYPTHVSGLVFVEASHPLEIAEQRALQPPFLVRAFNDGLKSVEKWFDPFKFSEDECIEETLNQLENAGAFPQIPMAVVSGTQKLPMVPEKSLEIHLHYQSKLLELSPFARHYPCEKSSHFPQITEPQKVVSAIEVVLEETNQSGSPVKTGLPSL